MANETFTLNDKQFNEVLKETQKRGTEVESVLNKYIHTEAPEKIKPSMAGLVPVSDRQKTHAKYSAPFGRQEDYNLAVKIITDKEFNYLVFPDEGLGTSVNNAPQDFTGRGLEAVTSSLIDEMIDEIMKKL